jgi:hypothetical protein
MMHDAHSVTFRPFNPTNWIDADLGTVATALNELAERVAGAVMESDLAANQIVSKDRTGNVAYPEAANNTLLGRQANAQQSIEFLSKADVLTLLNVEDGADVTDEANVRTALTTATGNVSINNQDLVDIGKIGSAAESVALGGTPDLGVFPKWYYIDMDHSDFTAAAQTEDLTLFVLALGGVIHLMNFRVTETCAGTLTATLSGGISGNITKYHTAYTWKGAVNQFKIEGPVADNCESYSGSTNILVRGDAGLGGHVKDWTPGTMRVYVLLSKAL